MANEIRLRSNNIAGTITDNPLTAGATTINSAGFVDLPVVDATNHLILILDPLEVGGTAEIVRVTAHTAAATSATVVRGQEGSSARSHVFNTTWFHGPVASDTALSDVTSGTRPSVPYTGELIYETDTGLYKSFDGSSWVDLATPLSGAWTTWTPTLANLTLGNGTVIARFTRIGRTIHFIFVFTLGSTSAVGTAPTFTLPVTVASHWPAFTQIGTTAMHDVGVGIYNGEVRADTSSVAGIRRIGGSGSASVQITATVPFTWTTGDYFASVGTYEAAS